MKRKAQISLEEILQKRLSLGNLIVSAGLESQEPHIDANNGA